MRFSFAAVLGFAPALLSQAVLEVEPNNTAATAQAAAPGMQIDGIVMPADQDWYVFTTNGGQIRLTTSGPADTRIVLWDSAGAVCQGANDDCRGIQSDLTMNLNAGTYTVQVIGFNLFTQGAYSLDIANAAPAKAFTATELEPNDLLAQAQQIALSAQVNGSLSSAADIDIYRVVLTAPRTGIWLQINEGEAPWISQHAFEILDAAGVPVAAATLGANAGNSGGFTYRTTTIRCWPAGTYHIVVRNRSTPPTVNPLPLGSYRLEVLALPMSTGAVVGENAEPNNTVATATPLQPGQQGTGSVSTTGGDGSDLWGPFAITSPSVLQVQTSNGAGTPILDTTIRLLQQDPQSPGTLLLAATATDGNILQGASGLHARGTYSFFVTGLNYYIAVDSPGTGIAQAGNYVLEVSALASAPYVTSSYSIVPSNGACGSAPFPTLTRRFDNETPTIGQMLVRAATGLEPLGFGILIQGTDNTAPVDVSAVVGSPQLLSCFLNVNPLTLALVPVDFLGRAELSLTIPASVALRGAILWEQIAKLNTATQPGIQVGNYARILVGDRSY